MEEEQAEKRNAGGAETVVDYQRARVTGENKTAFGSTLDRETYSTQTLFQDRDKSVPGPGMYIYQQQSTKLPPKLNSYEGRDGAVPTVLSDQIGPGAEKALQVLRERNEEQEMLGPGAYSADNIVTRANGIKHSFNQQCINDCN